MRIATDNRFLQISATSRPPPGVPSSASSRKTRPSSTARSGTTSPTAHRTPRRRTSSSPPDRPTASSCSASRTGWRRRSARPHSPGVKNNVLRLQEPLSEILPSYCWMKLPALWTLEGRSKFILLVFGGRGRSQARLWRAGSPRRGPIRDHPPALIANALPSFLLQPNSKSTLRSPQSWRRGKSRSSSSRIG